MSFTHHIRSSLARPRRAYATHGPPSPKSAHASLYASTFPAMIPVFLLGSAVYLALQLTQSKLAHEKHMHDALARVKLLEAEIDALQAHRSTQLSPPPTDTAPPPAPSRKWW